MAVAVNSAQTVLLYDGKCERANSKRAAQNGCNRLIFSPGLEAFKSIHPNDGTQDDAKTIITDSTPFVS